MPERSFETQAIEIQPSIRLSSQDSRAVAPPADRRRTDSRADYT